MACECDDQSTRNYYRYYDTSEGCDIDKKTMVTTKYGVITGLVFGTYDVLMYSHAVGFPSILKRYAYHVVPLGMIGATFALVANSLQHAREKNDRLNYFLGGLACGPIAAAYLGSLHAVLLGGLALGTVGCVKKTAVDRGVTLFPDIQQRGMIDSWRHDYTVAQDPKTLARHTCGRE